MAQAQVNWKNGFQVTGITGTTAQNAGPFGILGGNYGIILNAGTFGSAGTINVEIVDPAGINTAVVMSGTAAKYGSVFLPAGQLNVVTSGTLTNGVVVVAPVRDGTSA